MTPVETDRELLALMDERDALLRRIRRGEHGLNAELRALTDCITYTNHRWDRDPWQRHFRTHEGAIHNRALCSGMTRPARLVPSLSGVTDREVLTGHGRLCRHCLR